MIGIIIAGIAATTIGSVAAWKWGESQQKAVEERNKWIPWVIIIALAMILITIFILAWKGISVRPVVA